MGESRGTLEVELGKELRIKENVEESKKEMKGESEAGDGLDKTPRVGYVGVAYLVATERRTRCIEKVGEGRNSGHD